MTRFNITMDEALELIFRALRNGTGGEVFIPKLKAYKIADMRDAIKELLDSNLETAKIPVRPGEKFHESLISTNEIRNSYETEDDYVLFESETQNHNLDSIENIKKSTLTEEYSSDKVDLLTIDELKSILTKSRLV